MGKFVDYFKNIFSLEPKRSDDLIKTVNFSATVFIKRDAKGQRYLSTFEHVDIADKNLVESNKYLNDFQSCKVVMEISYQEKGVDLDLLKESLENYFNENLGVDVTSFFDKVNILSSDRTLAVDVEGWITVREDGELIEPFYGVWGEKQFYSVVSHHT